MSKYGIRITAFVLIAASLLFLGGCDAILEFAYPSFKTGEGKSFGDGTINASLEVYGLDVTTNPVKIAIIPIRKDAEGRPVADVEDAWIRSFWGLEEVVARFSPLPRERYRVFAMYDANGNGTLEFQEPSTELGWFDYGQPVRVFDFVEDEDRTEFEAEGVLDEYSRMDPVWLDQLAEGGGASALNFDIIGPDVLPPTGAGWHEFRLEPWGDYPVLEYRLWFTDGKNDPLSFVFESNATATADYTVTNPTSLTTWVDLGSSGAQLPPKLIAKAEITYEQEGRQVQWFNEFHILVTTEDPGFWIAGPSFVDRSSSGIHEVSIEPKTAGKTITSVGVEFYDAMDNSVAYDGVWGTYAYSDKYAGDGLFTFDVDFSLLSPSLSDPAWDGQDWLWAHVKVEYQDGIKWDGWYDVSLVDSGDGTVYDLSVFVDAASLSSTAGNSNYSSWEYWVYLVDYDQGNVLMDAHGFLDSSGAGSTDFYDVFDPTGLEQRVEIEVDYTGDGLPDVWEAKDLIGNLNGQLYADFIHNGSSFDVY